MSAGIVSAMFRRLPVLELLIDYGFIVKEGDNYRVKGTDCYVAKVISGRAGGDASAGKRKENQYVARHLQAEPKQKASRGQAEGKQSPSRAQANDEKEPSATPVLAPVPKQNQPEYRVEISPTERDLYTHEGSVGGPPQHAPGRGRAVAPPKPEPEPEPEWVPAPLCASGRHMVMRLDKRCLDCEREVNAPIEAAKKAAAEAERARIAAIPPPPKEHMAEGLTDAEMGPLLDLYVQRLKMRNAGQDWREAMQ